MLRSRPGQATARAPHQRVSCQAPLPVQTTFARDFKALASENPRPGASDGCQPLTSLEGIAGTFQNSMLSRRSALSILVSMGAAVGGPAHAENFWERGMSRYVKKKRLDPLDTYVPVVLEARDLLANDIGAIMVPQPEQARQLLRSGPFDGLRSNVRVLGEYAVINQKEAQAAPLVNATFRALEDFDLVLAVSVREDKPVDAQSAQSGLAAALKSLDALLATVPEDVMYRSKRVLEVARAKAKAAEEEAEEAAPAFTAQGSTSSAPAAPLAEPAPVTDAAVTSSSAGVPSISPAEELAASIEAAPETVAARNTLPSPSDNNGALLSAAAGAAASAIAAAGDVPAAADLSSAAAGGADAVSAVAFATVAGVPGDVATGAPGLETPAAVLEVVEGVLTGDNGAVAAAAADGPAAEAVADAAGQAVSEASEAVASTQPEAVVSTQVATTPMTPIHTPDAIIGPEAALALPALAPALLPPGSF